VGLHANLLWRAGAHTNLLLACGYQPASGTPSPPFNPVPIPTLEVIEISDDDDKPMERDSVEELWQQLSNLIKNCEEKI
jgi:hypothetical protein